MKVTRRAPYDLLPLALFLLGCPRSPPAPPPASPRAARGPDAASAPALPALQVSAACGTLPAGSVCMEGGVAQLGWHAPDARFAEGPPRAARLRAFALDAREVTAGQWRACVAAGGCPPMGCEAPDEAPARCVSWSEARAYCAARRGRLPTEAEWERAAAGLLPDHRPYAWGESAPIPDASAPADMTPEGVYDLAGSVAEWVEDGGDFYPPLPRLPDPDAAALTDAVAAPDGALADAATDDLPPQTESGLFLFDDPRGPARSPWRIARGGDAALPLARRGNTLRRFRRPADRLPWLGLRCAYDVPGPAPAP